MVRASVVGAEAAYEMFDVVSLDVEGARLVGPLLLEIGEEVTLRIARGGAQVEVRATVTRLERAGRDAATVFAFAEDAAEALSSVLATS